MRALGAQRKRLECASRHTIVGLAWLLSLDQKEIGLAVEAEHKVWAGVRSQPLALENSRASTVEHNSRLRGARKGGARAREKCKCRQCTPPVERKAGRYGCICGECEDLFGAWPQCCNCSASGLV
eukprot:6193812-Pleurochrysis_carterae.AAC.1